MQDLLAMTTERIEFVKGSDESPTKRPPYSPKYPRSSDPVKAHEVDILQMHRVQFQ
jgi:hypothetical protein